MIKRNVGVQRRKVIAVGKKRVAQGLVLSNEVKKELSRITVETKSCTGVTKLLNEITKFGLELRRVDRAHPEKMTLKQLNAYSNWAEKRAFWFELMRDIGGRSMSTQARRVISQESRKLEALQKELRSIIRKRV